MEEVTQTVGIGHSGEETQESVCAGEGLNRETTSRLLLWRRGGSRPCQEQQDCHIGYEVEEKDGILLCK